MPFSMKAGNTGDEFQRSGQVAAKNCLSSPNVANGMKELEGMLDAKSLQRDLGFKK